MPMLAHVSWRGRWSGEWVLVNMWSFSSIYSVPGMVVSPGSHNCPLSGEEEGMHSSTYTR